MVNKVGQSEYGSEGNDSSKKTEDKNVLEVLFEIFFLEIVSACKNHGWKQSIEKDLLIEINVFDIFGEEHQQTENQAYQNADSGLVDHMNLGDGRVTCLC